MKLSSSYYITLLIIKIKGLKKDFSKNPINYNKIRKADVHAPSLNFTRNKIVSSFKISRTKITEIKKEKVSNQLLIFIHGGAFISGPSKIHWDTINQISKETQQTIWMCDYPKAPESNIIEISKDIDLVYKEALKKHQSNQISLIGDSVGGTLITALVQRLIKNNIDLPCKIILISPVMDATLTNPQIDKLDPIDPMLSKIGVLSAKSMCAGNTNLNNEIISPLNGNFDNFPDTTIFIAENDITYPDQELAINKLKDSKVKLNVIVGKRMPHIWPLLPVMKEAKIALNQIISILKNL